jgi:hypothetical protein
VDKKDRGTYCYNQIVTLICAPLRINHSTLQNHLFALSIFDSLASIVATGDTQLSSTNMGSVDEDNVSKLAVAWIWHYVKMQIRRRSKEHTKEMHSVIVAAYNCLIMLLIAKPSLLRDKQCLQTVTNCIEIGISGSSSYNVDNPKDSNISSSSAASSNNNNNNNSGSGINSDSASLAGGSSSSTTLLKAEKELKPASLRVKEAAECVLCFLMEHTSLPPQLLNNQTFFDEAIRMPLDEKSIIELTGKQNANKFKYYAIDGSLIMGILERPLMKSGPVSNICPTVTLLLRGAFGQQAWSLHLRPAPYTKLEQTREVKFTIGCNQQEKSSNGNNSSGGTLKYYGNRDTLKAVDPNEMYNSSYSSSPSGNRGAQQPKCERSVPSLDQVARKYCKQLPKFQKLKDEQIDFENASVERAMKESGPSFAKLKANLVSDLCLNVKNCQDFQSSRILLSSLGYCSTLDCSSHSGGSRSGTGKDESASEIVTLDSIEQAILLEHLVGLDKLPTRTFSSCYIFYVKKNQTGIKPILNNINLDSQLDESFYLFIQSLGSIVNASNNVNNVQSSSSKTRKLNKINGVENVLFWSDIMNEIAFIIPNGATSASNKEKEQAPVVAKLESSPPPAVTSTSATSSPSNISNVSPSTTTTSVLTGGNLDEKLKIKYQSVPSDLKVIIVWLEQIQDADSIPVDELIQETYAFDNVTSSINQMYKPKEIIILFIHPLKNKLNRIITWSNTNKK